MSLCVGVLSGDFDETMLKMFLDAVAAKERIDALLREIEQLKRELEAQRERLAAEAELKIKEAFEQGEIAGRNARIEEHLRHPENVIPNIAGQSLASIPAGSIFDLAFGAR